MFNTGDMVSFRSPGVGNKKLKVGTVIAVIPADTHPAWARYVGTHNFKNVSGASARRHESYLVQVAAPSPNAQPFLYWPRVNMLSRWSGEEHHNERVAQTGLAS